MNSITLLIEKYQSFEDKLKQERLWLFVPIYLIKTALKYTICLLITYLLLGLWAYITIIYFNVEDTIWGNLFGFPIIILDLFLISLVAPVIFIVIFSRKIITLHPYLLSLISIWLYTHLLSFLYLFLLVTVLTIIHFATLCVFRFRVKSQ